MTRILLVGNTGHNKPTALNSTDWKLIRKWFGGGETAGNYSSGFHGHYLDMESAIFAADETPFYTDAESTSHAISQRGIVPDMAFAECLLLDTLILPWNTSHIGRSVFYGTRKSLVVQAPWETPVTDLDDQCFGENDADVSEMTLIVPRGTLEAYQNAEHWKAFGTIIEKSLTADEVQVKLICNPFSVAVQANMNGNTHMGTIDIETGLLTFVMQKTGRLQLRVPTGSYVVSKIFINEVDETANFQVTTPNTDFTYYTHPALDKQLNTVYVLFEETPAPVPPATLSVCANMGRVECIAGSRFEQRLDGGVINMTLSDGEQVRIQFFANALRSSDQKLVGKLSHVYRDGVDILSQLTSYPAGTNGAIYPYVLSEEVDGRNPQFVLVYDPVEDSGEPGDINGDGKVTIADVTKLVNIILGKE